MPQSTRLSPRFGLLAAAASSAVTLGYLTGAFTGAFSPAGRLSVRQSPGSDSSPPSSFGVARDRVSGFGPAVDVGESGRVPGEFEHKDALLLGVNELVQYHPDTLAEIVAAIDGQTRIIGLISKPEQEQRTLALLHSRGLETDTISFFLWPAESMWVQDFGPQVVVDSEPRVIDFEYQVPGREVEERLSMAFAATFGMKISHCHLAMEGGSYLSNGRGLCISSTRLIEQNQGLGLHDIGLILKRHFGFQQWCYLPPIVGESTGHVDMFLSIGGPSTVLLASYDPHEDRENAERMDANAGTLAETVAVDGRPLEIIRVPQPASRDGSWRSYTNVIYANGVVLVPQFPDFSSELDEKALAIYRKAFPDRRVVGIDASRLITKRGGLHCLSRSLHRLPAKPGALDATGE